jgi:hypothetical protein
VGNLDQIRSYYEALNSGDPALVASHFTEDAVHYYTRLGPHEGAKAIGENTKWAVEQIEGQWHIEGGIEQGDEACIEWTMTWRDPKSDEKRTRLPPRRPPQPAGRPARVRPRGSRPHDFGRLATTRRR